MRVLIFALVAWLKILQAHAQCPVIDVNIPFEVCRQTNFLIENKSAAESFEWDLCPFDLQTTPSLSKVVNTGLSSTIDFVLANDNTGFYGFAVDATSNSLLRLDFGNSRDNVPTRVNLGNVDGQFQFPNSISIVRQEGNWLGIVANGANGKIILIDFGDALHNVPVATVLYTRADGGFANLEVATTSFQGRALVIAEFNTRQVHVINYPQGFRMPPDTQQSITIPGSSPIDVQVLRQCEGWRALILSFDDHKLYHLDFGNSFTKVPVVSSYGVIMNFEPYRLSLVREGDFLHAFVSTTSGGIHRLDFGNDIASDPTVVSMGSFGVLSNSRSLFIDSKDGIWRGFMINFSDGDLFRFSFQKDCGVTPSYSRSPEPGNVAYTLSGVQRIAATAFGTDGSVSTYSHEVKVLDLPAPEFTIKQTNSCANNQVNFQAENVEGQIAIYQWNLGDGSTSTEENPQHTYSSSNIYTVSLQATGANACVNRKQIDAAIFDKPVAEFELPSAMPSCTNQNLKFVNSSQFQAASQPHWRWFVNSAEVSSEEDLSYTFDTVGPHNIKLIAEIPGCQSLSNKDLGPLTDGPKVDFEKRGICEGQVTTFLNKSIGDIDSFQWFFGDGNSSTDVHATNKFSKAGGYEVALTAVGKTGCMAQKTEIIQIRAKPIVDFNVSAPPSACSGVPARFENSSWHPAGEEIVRWNWTFGDASDNAINGEVNPEHTFIAPGKYNVSLFASTAFECTSSLEREIMIYESPSSGFLFSPACDDVPVAFTSSGVDIEYWYWEIGTSYYLTSSPSHTFRSPGYFQVRLEVTGTNGCESSMTSVVHVPRPLLPDFSVTKNCAGHEAVFTDVTITGTDPVVARQWIFGNGQTSSANSATHLFPQAGTQQIRLQVTTKSGCAYQGTKQIQISTPPQASFTASPATGALPLEVSFTNTSSAATAYRWEFMDGSGNISEEASPRYTYSEPGSFEVKLIAYNEEQCEDNFIQTITTLAPLPDVDLDFINVIPNDDGSAKVIVTIGNNGNTVLKSLPLTIDFGGVVLRQIVDQAIFPATKFNYVLNTTILDIETVRYLCVSLDLENDTDLSGNKMCKEFQNTLLVFPVHPNPAMEILNIEWISAKTGSLHLRLTDGGGRQVFAGEVSSASGLNTQRVPIPGVSDGIYILTLEDGLMRNSQRIMIQNAP